VCVAARLPRVLLLLVLLGSAIDSLSLYDHTTVPCHKLLAVKRRPRRLLSDSCEEQTEQLGMTLVRAAVLLVCPTQVHTRAANLRENSNWDERSRRATEPPGERLDAVLLLSLV
jgi:hypothetical protein